MTLGRRALMAAGYRLIMVVVICTPASLRADDPVEVLIEHQTVKPALLRIAIDRTIVFVKTGLYRLTATNVQTPEERGLTVLGTPNVLTLTVVVTR